MIHTRDRAGIWHFFWGNSKKILGMFLTCVRNKINTKLHTFQPRFCVWLFFREWQRLLHMRPPLHMLWSVSEGQLTWGYPTSALALALSERALLHCAVLRNNFWYFCRLCFPRLWMGSRTGKHMDPFWSNKSQMLHSHESFEGRLESGAMPSMHPYMNVYQIIPGPAGAEVSRENNGCKKSMGYTDVCENQKRWETEAVKGSNEWGSGCWKANELSWSPRHRQVMAEF